ncbi:MAG TPA: DinB family protein, partial [Vicinamibacterales bacterium]|nr:DinB family protein [Vicinamibacterales bacterium]
MTSGLDHARRVAATADAFEASMTRFLSRVEQTSEADAERVPPDGGWSVAGIAWHVAVTNEQFAALVDG